MEIFTIIAFVVLFMLMSVIIVLVAAIGSQIFNLTKDGPAVFAMLYQILGLTNQVRVRQEQIFNEVHNISRNMFMGPNMMWGGSEDENDFLMRDSGDMPFSFGAIKEPDGDQGEGRPLDKTPPSMLSLNPEELQKLMELFEAEISKFEKPDAQE